MLLMIFIDKYDWGALLTKLVFGVSVICLSALSKGSEGPIIDSEGNTGNSIIWHLLEVNWVYDLCHVPL